MGRKLASAFIYGWGFGVLNFTIALNQHRLMNWVVISVAFTFAYYLDKTSNGE